MKMHRNTIAVIDLGAIRSNFLSVMAMAQQSRSIAVIKADAYGHGMLRVAAALQNVAPAFAVATLEEALELRSAAISKPILLLQGVNNAEGLKLAAAKSLSLVVHNEDQLRLIERSNLPDTVPLWLKVDTGMHRLGFSPAQFRPALDRLGATRGNLVVCTHLACADDLASDATRKQLVEFETCMSGLDLPTSIANSAGILVWPTSHANWNRPGYLLYGASPMKNELESPDGFRAAMTLQSKIIAIAQVPAGESVGYGARWTAPKPTTVGTVAAGYADGYPRHAPNGTPTMVNGKIAPLVGNVSMDMLTIDLSEAGTVEIGDSVELWGQTVAINDVAKRSGTIGYELMTGVSSRVPRSYEQ